MNIKKAVFAAVAVLLCASPCFARPGGHHGGYHHAHHYHGGYWGHGGRGFWPGFFGGVAGAVVCDALIRPAYAETVVVQTPAVVTQPVVIQPAAVVAQPVAVTPQPQNVWVPGCYVDQPQPNGGVIRTWQPGHYELR